MSVVRDTWAYVGQVPLVSGEIAEDFAKLCRQRADAPRSEPGRAGQRRGGAVGGRGAAAAPAGGCTDDIISQLELRSPMADVGRELCHEPIAHGEVV